MSSISEMFYTIQGEGVYVGAPSVFVRINHCHMRCPWCDSKFAVYEDIYKKDPNYYDYKLEEVDKVIEKIKATYATCEFPAGLKPLVIITGGEPLHDVNSDFSALLAAKLMSQGHIVQFETTLSTKTEDFFNARQNAHAVYYDFTNRIFANIDYHMTAPWKQLHFSCSPKLETKCYERKDITHEQIMKYYYAWIKDSSYANLSISYKFVFSECTKMMLLDPRWQHNISTFAENTYIMPKTPLNGKREEYIEQCELAADFCKQYGFRYSPRVHVDIWGLKRGV